MPYKNSSWTQRAPRSLEEAFGHGSRLETEPSGSSRAHRAAYGIAIVLVIVGLAMLRWT